jgi:hypothetical protein
MGIQSIGKSVFGLGSGAVENGGRLWKAAGEKSGGAEQTFEGEGLECWDGTDVWRGQKG